MLTKCFAVVTLVGGCNVLNTYRVFPTALCMCSQIAFAYGFLIVIVDSIKEIF